MRDELEQLGDALGRDPHLGGDLVVRRVAVELLGQLAAGAQDLPHLLADVHRKADRAALVGQRT